MRYRFGTMRGFLTVSKVLATVWLFCAAGGVFGKGQGGPLEGVERVVFLGDSITQGGHYVADVECWMVAQGYDVEVLNLGLGSETASQLTKEENEGHLRRFGFGRPWIGDRLERLLEATKPDWIFLCYGMNDAENLPAGQKGLQRFSEAITELREKAFQSGVKRVVVCTPPVHDSKTDEPSKRQLAIASFAKWELAQREKGWDVVDMHNPMWARLQEGRAESRDFVLAKDGVHPQREGHWIMGREILRQLFDVKVEGLNSAEELFTTHGKKARGLVYRRMRVNFDDWMSEIGHQRPKTSGGPGVARKLSREQSREEVARLTKQLEEVLEVGE